MTGSHPAWLAFRQREEGGYTRWLFKVPCLMGVCESLATAPVLVVRLCSIYTLRSREWEGWCALQIPWNLTRCQIWSSQVSARWWSCVGLGWDQGREERLAEGLWCKTKQATGTTSPGDLQDDCKIFGDERRQGMVDERPAMKRMDKNV